MKKYNNFDPPLPLHYHVIYECFLVPLFPNSESRKSCVLCRVAERVGSDFCFVEFPAGLSGGLLQIESKTLSMSTIHLPRFCSKAATVPQFWHWCFDKNTIFREFVFVPLFLLNLTDNFCKCFRPHQFCISITQHDVLKCKSANMHFLHCKSNPLFKVP